MTPDPFATSAGAYILGALAPADRRAFERHLPECGKCRAAVSELAGLPGLLSRVRLHDVPLDTPPAPHEPSA